MKDWVKLRNKTIEINILIQIMVQIKNPRYMDRESQIQNLHTSSIRNFIMNSIIKIN